MLAVLPPVLSMGRQARGDHMAHRAAVVYALWVVEYDLPWAYRLWRLTRVRSALDLGDSVLEALAAERAGSC